MSVLATTPPGTVRALVTVQLAGGNATSTAGALTYGTDVTLDDVSLTRPKVAVGIKRSISTARSGRTVLLSGPVAPIRAIGADVVVWVHKPGSVWKKLATTHVYKSGGAAAWKSSFTFTRAMRRGTYSFKTTIPAVPGYLGTMTSYVSVKLK
jgi:hypothetical protein